MASARPALAGDDAAAARRKAIDATIARIDGELRRDGGGDWESWFRSLEPFRESLRERIRAAAARVPEGVLPARRATLLEAVGTPPMFEWKPESLIWYVVEPGESSAKFVADRKFPPAAAEVSRWLASWGIDLIVLTVPRMSEVYPERIGSDVPPDRIVAPQMRRYLREMLASDVEVIDLLPAFLEHSEKRPEPLYFSTDTHWQDTGRGIAAHAIAERLARYDFVRKAAAAPPLYRTDEWPECHEGEFWEALDPAQRGRVLSALEVPKRSTSPLGAEPVVRPNAPILFMGDSYVRGVPAMVAAELNVPVTDMSAANQMIDALVDIVREPSLLEGTRVAIWLNVTTSQVAFGAKLPPLPAPPAAAAK